MQALHAGVPHCSEACSEEGLAWAMKAFVCGGQTSS